MVRDGTPGGYLELTHVAIIYVWWRKTGILSTVLVFMFRKISSKTGL
jgi:hypothetical protein